MDHRASRTQSPSRRGYTGFFSAWGVSTSSGVSTSPHSASFQHQIIRRRRPACTGLETAARSSLRPRPRAGTGPLGAWRARCARCTRPSTLRSQGKRGAPWSRRWQAAGRTLRGMGAVPCQMLVRTVGTRLCGGLPGFMEGSINMQLQSWRHVLGLCTCGGHVRGAAETV